MLTKRERVNLTIDKIPKVLKKLVISLSLNLIIYESL